MALGLHANGFNIVGGTEHYGRSRFDATEEIQDEASRYEGY